MSSCCELAIFVGLWAVTSIRITGVISAVSVGFAERDCGPSY